MVEDFGLVKMHFLYLCRVNGFWLEGFLNERIVLGSSWCRIF